MENDALRRDHESKKAELESAVTEYLRAEQLASTLKTEHQKRVQEKSMEFPSGEDVLEALANASRLGEVVDTLGKEVDDLLAARTRCTQGIG